MKSPMKNKRPVYAYVVIVAVVASALGVLAHWLIAGRLPFTDNTDTIFYPLLTILFIIILVAPAAAIVVTWFNWIKNQFRNKK